MIREATAVFSLLAVLEILGFIIFSVAAPNEASAAIASFLQHPAVIVFNIIALLAVFYHTATWYSIMPIGVRVFRSRQPDDTRLVPGWLLTAGLWLCTIAATAIIIAVLYFVD